MKYLITVTTISGATFRSVTTTIDGIDFVSFPADIGNPNYDKFLGEAQLTDKQVHGLDPDTPYPFPT